MTIRDVAEWALGLPAWVLLVVLVFNLFWALVAIAAEHG